MHLHLVLNVLPAAKTCLQHALMVNDELYTDDRYEDLYDIVLGTFIIYNILEEVWTRKDKANILSQFRLGIPEFSVVGINLAICNLTLNFN